MSSRKYEGNVTELDLAAWRLDANTCQAINSLAFLDAVDEDDTRLLNILNRNSRFSIQVDDRFLAHNCTPPWRLNHSGKIYRPSQPLQRRVFRKANSQPNSPFLRKRMKTTTGEAIPEPDPVSFSVGLVHHGVIDGASFDPLCYSSNPLPTCPNVEKHVDLLAKKFPLPLACPECWSGQRRDSSKNAFADFYRELQKRWIENGNDGTYSEYRLLHRYSKLWKKSINVSKAEFKKMLKSLEKEVKQERGVKRKRDEDFSPEEKKEDVAHTAADVKEDDDEVEVHGDDSEELIDVCMPVEENRKLENTNDEVVEVCQKVVSVSNENDYAKKFRNILVRPVKKRLIEISRARKNYQ